MLITLFWVFGFTLATAEETIPFILTTDPDSEEIDWWHQIHHPQTIKNIPKARGWTHLNHKDQKIAVIIGMDQLDGASLVPVSAYIYNEYFKEWRQFLSSQVSRVGKLRAQINGKHKLLEIIGDKNSAMEGAIICSFSLKAVENNLDAARRQKEESAE